MNKLKTYNKMKSMFRSNGKRDFDSLFREEIVDSYSVSRKIVNNIKLSSKGKKRKNEFDNESNS
jgi:hypothetical protein